MILDNSYSSGSLERRVRDKKKHRGKQCFKIGKQDIIKWQCEPCSESLSENILKAMP